MGGTTPRYDGGETGDGDTGVRGWHVPELQQSRMRRSDDDHVRLVSVNALGNIGDERAAEPLVAVLEDQDEDEDWRIRRRAHGADQARRNALNPPSAYRPRVRSSALSEAAAPIGERRNQHLIYKTRASQRQPEAEAPSLPGGLGRDRIV